MKYIFLGIASLIFSALSAQSAPSSVDTLLYGTLSEMTATHAGGLFITEDTVLISYTDCRLKDPGHVIINEDQFEIKHWNATLEDFEITASNIGLRNIMKLDTNKYVFEIVDRYGDKFTIIRDNQAGNTLIVSAWKVRKYKGHVYHCWIYAERCLEPLEIAEALASVHKVLFDVSEGQQAYILTKLSEMRDSEIYRRIMDKIPK